MFPVSPQHPEVLAPVQSRIPSLIVFGWSGALTFGYGCTIHVGVDVGAGDVVVDVVYVSFTRASYASGTWYRTKTTYKNKWTTVPLCAVLEMIT